MRISDVMTKDLVTADPDVNHKEWLRMVFETFGINPGKLINSGPSAQEQQQQLLNLQAPQQAPSPEGTDPNVLGTETGTNFITRQPTG